tara:strand:- start:1163 stop:1381 length:219 start_codon:yes stop_codon:yes gene_type:complete
MAEATASKSKKKAPTHVVYESREPEPAMFDCAGYSSVRSDSDNRLQWIVDANDEKRFVQHHFVVTGRIVKAK